MKTIINLSIIAIFTFITFSCTDNKKEQAKTLAGNNWNELQKVLDYYKSTGEEQKYNAAEFLISNMIYEKYWYEGELITRFDTILYMYKALRNDRIFTGDPVPIKNVWDSLIQKYGKLDPSKLNKRYDCQNLKADFLVRNINIAFDAWEHSPYYNPFDFEKFCEYILPYRISNEPLEDFRIRYYHLYKNIVDTSSCIENVVRGFHNDLTLKQQYRASQLLWDYPLDLPISKMEIAHRGACRHNTMFQTLAMRACGLPVTIDRAVWANRSIGHAWNVILLDSGKIFPFDALDRTKIEFVYKPAKIFRQKFSFDTDIIKGMDKNISTLQLQKLNEVDVTNEYCITADITIPIKYNLEKYRDKKTGVICVFDNKNWKVVYFGKIKTNVMVFEKMGTDIAYIAAFYENGKIIPASEPFLLKKDSTVEFCKPDIYKKISLRLNRKYPRFKRIEDFAWGVRRSNAEGSDYPDFRDSTVFFSVYDIPFQWVEFPVKQENNFKRFRYYRFNASMTRRADYAEVQFYGKKSLNDPEVKLEGNIIGYPQADKYNEHPYTHAFDGNLETWFDKRKDSVGWVGLDLGKNNKHYLTKIRYCPRSDTNFIIEGDNYELMYWDKQWVSLGSQIAADSILIFNKVPSGTIYLLHDKTQGKEERIFTYENGKQVWW